MAPGSPARQGPSPRDVDQVPASEHSGKKTLRVCERQLDHHAGALPFAAVDANFAIVILHDAVGNA